MRLTLLAVCLVGFVVFVSPKSIDRNGLVRLNPPHISIINGIPAQAGDFPFMASLLFPLNATVSRLCGGSLIASSYILTAAHCVDGLPTNTGSGYVFINTLNLTGGGPGSIVRRVSSYVAHQQFYMNTTHIMNDVALLVLNQPVLATDNIPFVQLPIDPDLTTTTTQLPTTTTTTQLPTTTTQLPTSTDPVTTTDTTLISTILLSTTTLTPITTNPATTTLPTTDPATTTLPTTTTQSPSTTDAATTTLPTTTTLPMTDPATTTLPTTTTTTLPMTTTLPTTTTTLPTTSTTTQSPITKLPTTTTTTVSTTQSQTTKDPTTTLPITTTQSPTTTTTTTTLKPTTKTTTSKPTTKTTTLQPTRTTTTMKPTTRTTTTIKPTTTTKTTTTLKPTTKTTTLKPTTRTTTTMKPTTKTTTTFKPTTKTTTTLKSTTRKTTTMKPTTTKTTTVKPTTIRTTMKSTITTTKPSTIKTIKTTTKRVAAHQRAFSTYSNQSAIITGWGVTSSGSTSWTLQKANVTVYDNTLCNQEWGRQFNGSTQVCAAQVNTATCFGDSGGPLLVNGNVQIGIVSFGSGNGCADPVHVPVFTRVSAYLGWIADTMASNPPPASGK